MLKKVVLTVFLLVTSMTSQAALISYNGYERDSASNIVTGGGLEWLKWDLTTGMSIDAALSIYAADGWTLATNDNMAALFNSFQFGKVDWNSNESIYQGLSIPWDLTEQSNHLNFVHLFGDTWQASATCDEIITVNCYLAEDDLKFTRAFFGADLNNNGRFNFARVNDDYSLIGFDGLLSRRSHLAELSADFSFSFDSSSNTGVALVRNAPNSPISVPLPSSFILLAFGLVALGYRRRKTSFL